VTATPVQMIAHIAIVARDYDEAIDFYTRAPGFKLLRVPAMPFNLPGTIVLGRGFSDAIPCRKAVVREVS
jgi:catechol 2,3-dioxygenase-like lactoylglutathione lyase family enzyme